MSPAGSRLRFAPPRISATPELCWVLARAFAAPDRVVPGPMNPQRGISLAMDLDLLGRIASRIPAAQLAEEVGTPGKQAAIAERHRVAASTLRILRTAGRVADTAAMTGIPVAFLKGAALHLSGQALVSARGASDVDVLVPAGRAADLQQALLARGFRPRGATRSPHHLAPLGQQADPWVELHLEVPGVTVPGSPGPMTFDALAANDLLLPLATQPGRAWVPASAILAAHALVHGIDDHGFGADRYPLMRMPCDIADIVAATPLGPSIAERVQRFVGDGVRDVEMRAAFSLVDRLLRGDLSLVCDPSPAGRLLSHLLAGAVDPDYRDALRLRQIAFLLRHGSLALLGHKLGQRLDVLSPRAGPDRMWKAVLMLARMVRAEIRVRASARPRPPR